MTIPLCHGVRWQGGSRDTAFGRTGVHGFKKMFHAGESGVSRYVGIPAAVQNFPLARRAFFGKMRSWPKQWQTTFAKISHHRAPPCLNHFSRLLQRVRGCSSPLRLSLYLPLFCISCFVVLAMALVGEHCCLASALLPSWPAQSLLRLFGVSLGCCCAAHGRSMQSGLLGHLVQVRLRCGFGSSFTR